jgi:cyclohexadienyl dehydratase
VDRLPGGVEVARKNAHGRALPANARAHALVAVAFAAALIAGAAGAKETAAPHAQPASPAPQPAAAGKTLRVATSGDYAPFTFEKADAPADAMAGLDGLDVEIARRFALERGYRVEVVRFRWPDLSKELAAGSFDVAMSGVTVRPERSIAGRLSVPVAATQAVALTWKGSGVTSIPELDRPGRRVAVNAGGHLEKVAHQVFRRADVLPIADNAAVRMALLDRTADAVVTDNFEEKVWTVSAPDAVRIGRMSDDRKAYLLPAAKAELAAELDRWLLAKEADGTLASLRKRYIRNNDGSEVTSSEELFATAEPVAAFAGAVRERLALMPFVYEAKKAEGKPVEDKAQEAAVLDGAVRAVAAEAEAAGTDAPEAETVRELFATLIEIGKDAQNKLADADARRRPGKVAKRPEGDEAGDDAGKAAGDPGADAPDHRKGGDAKPARRHTGPDLATELRPAIARIGEKIARILVAMKTPVSKRDARSKLDAALAGQGVASERLDALAGSVSRLASGARR